MERSLRSWRPTSALLVALALLGCNRDGSLAPGAVGATPAGPHTGSIRFSPDMKGAVAEPVFAIPELVDLGVGIHWEGPDATGQTTQLRFYSPNGRLFFERTLEKAGNEAWTTLPVGGTLIARRSLAGTWRVEARLEDGSSASAQFGLEP